MALGISEPTVSRMLIWQQKILRVCLSRPLPNWVTQNHELYWVSVPRAAVFCPSCLLPCPSEAMVWLISEGSADWPTLPWSIWEGVSTCWEGWAVISNTLLFENLAPNLQTIYKSLVLKASYILFYVLTWRSIPESRGHQIPALWGFVSCCVGARNQTRVLHYSINSSSAWVISPALQSHRLLHSLVCTFQG